MPIGINVFFNINLIVNTIYNGTPLQFTKFKSSLLHLNLNRSHELSLHKLFLLSAKNCLLNA